MKRQVKLGVDVNTLSLKKSEALDQLKLARNEASSIGCELKTVPMTSLQVAVEEAYSAIGNCLKRWSHGERGRYPKYRSAFDEQQFKFKQFSEPTVVVKGKSRLTISAEFMGLGKVKFRSHQLAPAGAELTEVRFVKDGCGSISARLLWRSPGDQCGPSTDMVETGEMLHLALCHLPPDASPGAILDAIDLKYPGIGAGGDLGLTKPLTDQKGISTKRVFVPKAEVVKIKDLQCQIAKKPNKRSKTRRRLIKRLRSYERHHRNRLQTRAQQDAAWLVRRDGVRLVATEPNVMVQRLLGQIKDVDPLAPAPKPVGTLASSDEAAARKKRRQRMLRRRLHETGFAARLNHVQRLSDKAGVLYLQPEYRGSTQDCSWCGIRVPKNLWQRRHQCPQCGVDADRDHNAARNLLARALRKFITSEDPDGMIQKLLSEKQAKLDKKIQAYDRRQAGLRKRWDKYQQEKQSLGDVVVPAAARLRNISIEKIQTETLPDVGLAAASGLAPGKTDSSNFPRCAVNSNTK